MYFLIADIYKVCIVLLVIANLSFPVPASYIGIKNTSFIMSELSGNIVSDISTGVLNTTLILYIATIDGDVSCL